MAPAFNHGRRLTRNEYQKAIVALHSRVPPLPSGDRDTGVRKAELNLAIDYRLGVDFPPDRREALWKVQQHIEKRRVRLALWHLLPRFSGRRVEQDANLLASHVARYFANVLSRDELAAFLGDEVDGDAPGSAGVPEGR